MAHNQQQEMASQQSSSSSQVTVNAQPTHQQVPNNRVEFVQHHNIDMVNHVDIHSVTSGNADRGCSVDNSFNFTLLV